MLQRNSVQAVLQVQSTERAGNGVFVSFHSAVALAGGADWNEDLVRTALANVVCPNLTTGDLGVRWRPVKGYYELDGLWTLQVAVHGKYLIVSDDDAMIGAMVANLDRKIDSLERQTKPATFIAGFDHRRKATTFRVSLPQLTGPISASRGLRGLPNAGILFGEYCKPQYDPVSYRFGKHHSSLCG